MSGIFSEMMKGSPLGNMNVIPQLTQNEIVVELTEPQLLELLLINMKPTGNINPRDLITLKIVEGKIVIKIRLF